MLALSLLGFTWDDAVQVGEDPVALPISAAQALADPPAVEALRARWGDWRVRWDDRNGTPHVAVGPPVDLGDASTLAAAIAALGAVDPRDLVPEGSRTAGDRTGVRFRQTWRGAPIENGYVDVVATDGRVNYVVAALHRVDLTEDPRPGEVVLPRLVGDRFGYALVTRSDDGTDVVYRDRSGAEVHRWSHRMPLDVTYHEREPSGVLVQGPERNVLVSDGILESTTDDAGQTSLVGPLNVKLDTPNYTAFDGSQIVAAHGVDDGVLDSGVDLGASGAAIGPFFYAMRDWLALRDPTHPYLDADVALYLDTAGTCNAFYGGGSVTFYAAGGGCPASAQLADVVYHENGHGIHDYGLVAGSFVSDVSEGSADFVSATINDDSNIAVGFFGPGTVLREIATDKIYPQDLSGDPHASGLIWAGFWWDVREDYVATMGYNAGTALTDVTFIDALKYGPVMTDYEAVLAADDDDGDLANGTPHQCTLLTHAAEHGLAPDPLTLVRAVPDGPGDLPSGHPSDPPTVVPFHLAGADGCAGLDPEGVRLNYVVDPPADAAPASLAFTEVAPTHVAYAFEGQIPAQPAGAHVVWYASWSDGGAVQVSSPLFEYFVGDQADLWCDDFEAGQGAWTAGGGALNGGSEAGQSEFEWGAPPAERDYGATAAVSGGSVLGQRLTDGRTYHANNEQHATSPSLDLSGANRSLLLLSYQRWLSVDAAQYDRAQVVVDGLGAVWSNPKSSLLIDDGWTPVEHDLAGLVSGGALDTAISFTLTTDGSVAYDGWNLDDVCLRTLADPGRHYRGVGLLATDDQPDRVDVTWTAPWVEPLVALELVRSLDGVPGTPDEGQLVFADQTPVPGAPGAYTDLAVQPGEAWSYALFAADADGHWYDAVLGENADAGGIPAVTTPTTPDSGTKSAETDGGGCGCATGSPSGGVAAALAMALIGRRRRSLATAGRAARGGS